MTSCYYQLLYYYKYIGDFLGKQKGDNKIYYLLKIK